MEAWWKVVSSQIVEVYVIFGHIVCGWADFLPSYWPLQESVGSWYDREVELAKGRTNVVLPGRIPQALCLRTFLARMKVWTPPTPPPNPVLVFVFTSTFF